MAAQSRASNSEKHDVEAVKYIGIARIRRITDSEWSGAGIKNQKSVEWNVLNGFTVSGTDLTPDAIRALEEDDGMALLRKDEEVANEG